MQTWPQHPELERVNHEIEKSCKKNWKEKREKDRTMANQAAQGA